MMNDFIEKTIKCIHIVCFWLDERMNIWEVSSLIIRHYLSPMDFVELDTPNLFTNNEDGI